MAWVFLAFCCFSYSETGTGTSPVSALSWTMSNVLPNYSGLLVNSLTYRYTVTKVPSDTFLVTVQNADTQGGYLFRNVDDWSNRPGNTITKSFALEPSAASRWGTGSITTQGTGEVSNPYVLYSYRYDTCSATVILDPKCPGYKASISTTSVYDPLQDDAVRAAIETKNQPADEQEFNRALLSDKAETKRSAASKAAQNSLITAEALNTANAFESLNNMPAFTTYYAALPGGAYRDVLVYPVKTLPQTRNSLRLNLSQQLLHTKLVDLQYPPKD